MQFIDLDAEETDLGKLESEDEDDNVPNEYEEDPAYMDPEDVVQLCEDDPAAINPSNIVEGKRTRRPPERFQHENEEEVLARFLKENGMTVSDAQKIMAENDESAPEDSDSEYVESVDGDTESDGSCNDSEDMDIED